MRSPCRRKHGLFEGCLLYTSDAADERSSVDLGGSRIINKKIKKKKEEHEQRDTRESESTERDIEGRDDEKKKEN